MTLGEVLKFSSIFILFVLLGLNLYRRHRFESRLWSIAIGFIGYAFKFFLFFLAFGSLYKISNLISHYHPIRWILGWHLGLVCLLVADFTYYVAHFTSHKFNFLWRTHALHHSDNEVVFETHFRHSLTSAVLFFSMAILMSWITNLGLWYIFFYLGIVGMYQFLMHSPRWHWPKILGYFLILPQNHRFHHTLIGKDKNYGGLFSFWDRIFDTYSNEEFKPEYGIKLGHKPRSIRGILWYEDLEP